MPKNIKFLNLLFHAIRKSEYDFVTYRHKLESQAFTELGKENSVKFLKLHEPDYVPYNYTANEYFFKGWTRFFHIPLSMYRYILKEKPDVVLVHGFIFSVQVFFLKLILPSRTRIMVQHHSENPYRHPVKRWIQKLAYSRTDAYLFSSRDLAQGFLDCGTIKSADLIYEVMEGSGSFSKKSKARAREKLKIQAQTMFLWVGRLNQNKDPLTVLKAFRSYKESARDFKLYMIYGTVDMEEEVKSFIKENDLGSHIILVGRITHEDLEDWFNAADYFVSASYYEGSGYALCEAMSCGCVPVVTRIPSFRFMTDEGAYGYLFEPGNDKDLLRLLLNLDQNEFHKMEEKVIAKFERDLSFQGIGRKLSAIMDELLASKNP